MGRVPHTKWKLDRGWGDCRISYVRKSFTGRHRVDQRQHGNMNKNLVVVCGAG